MTMVRDRAPAWFWIVAVLIVLWGAVGVAAFYLDVTMSAADIARLSDDDRRLLASRPTWFVWLYGFAVWSALAGGVLQLLRRGIAQVVFVLSLVAVIAMFGYFFAVTDLIAVKGFVAAAGFPIVIAVIAAFEVWFAALARGRRWIV